MIMNLVEHFARNLGLVILLLVGRDLSCLFFALVFKLLIEQALDLRDSNPG